MQIETRYALERLEAMRTSTALMACLSGPSDLAASLGYLGRPQHYEVQTALREAVTRIGKAGKYGGILTSNEVEAERYIAWGFRFLAVGTDIGLLSRGAAQLRNVFVNDLKILQLGPKFPRTHDFQQCDPGIANRPQAASRG